MGNFDEALASAEEAASMGGLGEIELPNLSRIVALRRIVKVTSIDWPKPEEPDVVGAGRRGTKTMGRDRLDRHRGRR